MHFRNIHTALYPRDQPKKGGKKFGYTADDAAAAEHVFDNLGLKKIDEHTYCRHPLAFLTEAADDICYLTTDVEDAYRVGLIEFQEAEDILRGIAAKGPWIRRYGEIDNELRQDKISYLRSGAVSSMMEEVANRFVDHYNHIMTGTLTASILEQSNVVDYVNRIRDLYRNKIYYYPKKIEVEVAAFNILAYHLEMFCRMADELSAHGSPDKLDAENMMVYRTLPSEARKRLGSVPYLNFMVVTDYLSGMTDRFALELYQRLSGNSSVISRMI